MIFINRIVSSIAIVGFSLLVGGCSSSSPTPTTTCSVTQTHSPTAPSGASGANVVSVSVNGSQCASYDYQNEPCVTVTICQPNTSNCQTINNILLDTGSFGLRIFSSLVTETLSSSTCDDSGVLAECVGFGDGSSDWGQVMYADVKLGGESAVTMPVQLIDPNFSNPPSICTSAQSTPDTDPVSSQFNGILGIGVEPQDCGSLCATSTDAEQYYSCSSSGCIPTTVPVNGQLANAVALQATDNNGSILKLPSLTGHQATSVEAPTGADGTGLYLGIGTQTNNVPPTTGLNILYAAENGTIGNDAFLSEFTAYAPVQIPGFIDSGSSALFIPPPANNSLPDCDSAAGGNEGEFYQGLFCPTFSSFSNPLSFTATNFSLSPGTNSNTVTVYVNNAYQLIAQDGSTKVFDDFAANGGVGSDASFDLGLPFFFGKSIYIGIDGTSNTTLGTGPYWAY
jgi:hypothetical protein